MHTAGLNRQKLRLHDSRLCCDAVRGVGWFARCACGWESERPYRLRGDAIKAARQHRDAYRSCGL